MPWVYDLTPAVEALSIWRTIVGLTLASTILMVAVCVIRWWINRKSIGSEDWLLFLAMLCNIVYATFTILQTRYGLGLPVPLRPKALHQRYILYNYVARGPNIVAVAVSKIALCITCLKIIRQTWYTRLRWFVTGLAIFTGAYWFALCMIEIFNCRPFLKVLDASIPGYCIPYGPPLYWIWIINVFDDVLVYLIPIPLILRHNLDRAVKIGLVISFAMGLFTTVFSILKITQIDRIVNGDRNSSLLVLYTMLEGNIGTISASWPTLRVLVMRGLRNLSVSMSAKVSKSLQSYEMTTSKRSTSVPIVNTAGTDSDKQSEVRLVQPPIVRHWEGEGILKTVQYNVAASDSRNVGSRDSDHNWE